MHHLEFEKIIDKLGSKYEAVVRMSVFARKIADHDLGADLPPNHKVTNAALNEYMQEHGLLDKAPTETKE